MNKLEKLIIITAPSGAGKTTIVQYLLNQFSQLAFSISATTRQKRMHEIDGKDYYFLTVDDFKQKIDEGAFVEWEEVYPNKFYGTLFSELNRIWSNNKQIIFDVDVKGAVHLQEIFKQQSITIFIKPPSEEILVERLKNRKTETADSLAIRLERVRMELMWESKFNFSITNDQLSKAKKDAEKIVHAFLIDDFRNNI